MNVELGAYIVSADELLGLIEVCRKCRMCADTCPTYEGWLSQSPMGRVTSIYYHFKYGVGSREELSALLYSCASCGKCRERCRAVNAGANPSDIIIKARQLLVAMVQKEKE